MFLPLRGRRKWERRKYGKLINLPNLESFTCNLEAERDDRETKKEKHFSRAKSI